MEGSSKAEKDYWVPLESNPAVLTKFAAALGVPAQFGFSDCLGLDDELLAMVPQPCFALLFLFPYSKMKPFKQQEHDEIVKKGQHISPNVYFMKQLVGNACGTVAVVHCLANNAKALGLQDGFFTKFLEKTKGASANDRGKLFGAEEPLAAAADSVANDSEAQTEFPTTAAQPTSASPSLSPTSYIVPTSQLKPAPVGLASPVAAAAGNKSKERRELEPKQKRTDSKASAGAAPSASNTNDNAAWLKVERILKALLPEGGVPGIKPSESLSNPQFWAQLDTTSALQLISRMRNERKELNALRGQVREFLSVLANGRAELPLGPELDELFRLWSRHTVSELRTHLNLPPAPATGTPSINK